ncbi:hypothetical protein [Pseudarthrobacter sp. SSS035]|uniref:hypothetical protein n=1 Tax=Pseudarthrobacter sp. SSS035 TaxID=2931399 RepID=UPI00200DB0B3|nr:hypothetical protein [Pseudarthrobacter sp. SSS035]
MTGDGRTGSNWGTAETKSISYAPTAALWRNLTVTPGTTLALGAVRTTDIPDGELTGFGFYNTASTGFVRIRDAHVICF